jgi:hypothetical protein
VEESTWGEGRSGRRASARGASGALRAVAIAFEAGLPPRVKWSRRRHVGWAREEEEHSRWRRVSWASELLLRPSAPAAVKRGGGERAEAAAGQAEEQRRLGRRLLMKIGRLRMADGRHTITTD